MCFFSWYQSNGILATGIDGIMEQEIDAIEKANYGSGYVK